MFGIRCCGFLSSFLIIVSVYAVVQGSDGTLLPEQVADDVTLHELNLRIDPAR